MGSAFKSVLALVSGNSVATAIGFLIYPLLTRIYSSDEFGVFSIFASVCGVLTLLANAEFHNAIVLPKEKEDSVACFHLSLLSTITVCVLSAVASIIVFAVGDCEFNTIGDAVLLVAPCVLLYALWNALNGWYTKIGAFKKVAIFQTTQASTLALFKVILGYLRLLFNGMSLAMVVGQAVALIHNISTSVQQNRPLLQFDWERCKKCAAQYAKFPLLSLPRSFVNYVSGNLPFFLLPFYFTNDNIGYFSLAITLAFRPINILSTSLYQVFFQKSAKSMNEGERLMPFLQKFTLTTLAIAIPLLTIVYFITPSLVTVLLGEGWNDTSEYVRMMLPWLATSLIVAPICYFTDLFLKQRVGLILEVSHLLVRVVALCYGIYQRDFSLAIALYCAANVVMILVNYIWLYYIVKQYDENITTYK